jgi:hypothetical protein
LPPSIPWPFLFTALFPLLAWPFGRCSAIAPPPLPNPIRFTAILGRIRQFLLLVPGNEKGN